MSSVPTAKLAPPLLRRKPLGIVVGILIGFTVGVCAACPAGILGGWWLGGAGSGGVGVKDGVKGAASAKKDSAATMDFLKLTDFERARWERIRSKAANERATCISEWERILKLPRGQRAPHSAEQCELALAEARDRKYHCAAYSLKSKIWQLT